jgi:hypothetical protein
MDLKLFMNLLDPAVLMFFLGVFAILVKSNLEIPPAIAKFLSLYLLMALGLKGGGALRDGGYSIIIMYTLGIAILMSALVPLYSYFILSRNKKLGSFNAAAIAATYGSVSAVTFIVAGGFLARQGGVQDGYMTAAMVIMAVMFATMIRIRDKHLAGNASVVGEKDGPGFPVGKILKEAFTDGTHMVLLGSMFVGFIVGHDALVPMKPFIVDIFKGMLALFMLEMGTVVARRLPEIRKVGLFLAAFALTMPVLNAAIGILLAHLIGLPPGNAFIFAVLCASASYIAVPAVCRFAIPEANPSQYFTMSLAMTFPFNLVVGIPLYFEMVSYFWR